MKQVKEKVFAYITHITHGHRLLVFRHPAFPEVGIQVPAGTVKMDEHPERAVFREAFEETGLADLVLVSFLGEQTRDMSDCGCEEIHHRRFYHLYCPGNPPETWFHEERDPSDGTSGPILFAFFWVPFPDGVPTLIADHGNMLPVLAHSLFHLYS